jgi:RHS repeat-associated protein
MAENYMARKDSLWSVVCLSPDVCFTPVGPVTLPVPYQVTASLGDAVQEVKHVKANGFPVVVLNQSFIPSTQGDESGVAKGVQSGTVGAKCEPMEHSKTVRVGGKPILRHGDKFWMNDKNTLGVIVGQPPSANLTVEEIIPAAKAQTPEEEGSADKNDGKLPDSAWFGAYLAAGAIRNGSPESYEAIAQSAGADTLKGFQKAMENQHVYLAAAIVIGGAFSGKKSGKLASVIPKENDVPPANAYPPRPAPTGGGGKVKLKTDGYGKAATSKHGEPTVSDKKEGNFGRTCGLAGEPVDVATGDFLQNLQVIDLPGTLPLTLNRVYRSRARSQGIFGNKWADNWSPFLRLDDKEIHFTTEEGSVLSYFSSAEKDKVEGINLHQAHLRLHGTRSGTLFVFNALTQQTLCFAPQPGAHRKLSSLCDRAGNRIDFIYQHDRLSALTHSDGYRLELEWRGEQLVSITRSDTHARHWLVRCAYGDGGLLADCETFQFTHLFHEYDANGFMTRWRDTDKTNVSYQYDVKGRVTATRAEGGYYHDRFVYDDVNRVTTYLDGEGGSTLYAYNVFGQVTRTTDPLGRVTQTRWDRGNKIAETDPLGRETRYRHNPSGLITQVQRAGGDVTHYHYDRHGQVIRLIQPAGGEWLFTRSEQGNMISQTDPQGHVQRFEYNTRGQPTADIRPDGATQRYIWNAYHQLSQLISPDEATTHLSHDSFGRLQCVTDALGQTTRITLSTEHAGLQGSATAVHLPDGVVQRRSYDGEKRQATVTDGEGKTTGYAYGAFDLLHTLTRPDGQTLQFGYDLLTRLNQVTNAAGEVWRYERDAAGQVIRETDFGGRVTEYSYDAAGRRVMARHADHRVVCWHWSVRDELLSEDVWQEDETQCARVATTAYAYDAQGRMTWAQNSDAVVEFEYDAAGHRVCERINGREVVHGWDEQAQRTLSSCAGGQMLTFDYDISGRLNALQAGEFAPLRMEYDRLGRENQRHSAAGFAQAQGYSPTGMLLEQTAGREGIVNRRWAYDGAYNVRRIDDARWGTSHYHYNSNDQIIYAEQTGAQPLLELFSYDANLNIREHQWRGRDYDALTERVSQIRQSGRIIRRGSDEYRYDSAGRLIEKRTEKPGYRPEIWRYRWDAHGQMRSLITPHGERWRYAYDAFGRRISKRREGDTRGKPAGFDFLWSGDQLIEETPVYADGTPVYEESIHWLYEPGALTPVARSEKGRLHYLVSDHMGTPRELLTEQGDVAWSNRLSTWGKSTRYHLAANDDITCNLRFAGQYADEESGLHYNRHRYYDSDTGQYLSPDPIGLLGGVNPYGYVHNPMGWVDPLGLEKLETGHVYRMGSGTDSNMTPRPGKDTTTGLSTTIEKPSGKYQTLDVAALNNSGFDVIQDGKNHASVRLSNDPDMTKLREWADSRGSDIQSPYTKAIKDCCG